MYSIFFQYFPNTKKPVLIFHCSCMYIERGHIHGSTCIYCWKVFCYTLVVDCGRRNHVRLHIHGYVTDVNELHSRIAITDEFPVIALHKSQSESYNQLGWQRVAVEFMFHYYFRAFYTLTVRTTPTLKYIPRVYLSTLTQPMLFTNHFILSPYRALAICITQRYDRYTIKLFVLTDMAGLNMSALLNTISLYQHYELGLPRDLIISLRVCRSYWSVYMPV